MSSLQENTFDIIFVGGESTQLSQHSKSQVVLIVGTQVVRQAQWPLENWRRQTLTFVFWSVDSFVHQSTCSQTHPQILEAGPHSLDVERNVQPVRYMINLLNANKEAKNFTLHISQPTEAVANRQIVFPAGRVLGGGSSVNCKSSGPSKRCALLTVCSHGVH
jgi:hypothetical protein